MGDVSTTEVNRFNIQGSQPVKTREAILPKPAIKYNQEAESRKEFVKKTFKAATAPVENTVKVIGENLDFYAGGAAPIHETTEKGGPYFPDVKDHTYGPGRKNAGGK